MERYIPQGVCPKEIQFNIENGTVKDVNFIGGCPGNLKAISTLIDGMPVEEVISKFKGNICRNQTSCADQLAKALEERMLQNP
ncbi:MAG: TIGR03905 family TSCPD domain-containing protein [Anaeromusa sp.]|uniref:TIGR03905 family TSCPD domain-containing protein n=1 Tax=Anaeromusa sp. TaxID=1872520 RepID=UPI0026049CE6|nr:TIGR03905 family TSCPD domain-containing protein [Anaeromusa sp.]MDD3157906.1 TIGR03905 family TSCPD domain-containing protein [Anaeromusa sp.]MEA4836000.1 TIGR03905 family TSCPD domain-containing protein [Anaeromusa sp.]NCB76183.1 TIGR03905 family TSCPD domain-containing protein [Negativicutes bacterium]